jgi:hypothetical protein
VSEIYLPVFFWVRVSLLDGLTSGGSLGPGFLPEDREQAQQTCFTVDLILVPTSSLLISPWVASQSKWKVSCTDFITFHWVAWGQD